MTKTRQIPFVSPEYQLPAALAAGALVRMLLFASSSIPAVLQRRPELTTPITSFRSLHEGVFLREHGMNPYSGGVFHHAPFYLIFFTSVVPISSRVLTALLWTLGDVVAAILLVRVWRSRAISRQVAWVGRDHFVALLYLFNPYTLLSCLARSTTSLDNVFIIGAIAAACTGAGPQAMALLALATHTSLYPVILLPPLLLVLYRTPERPPPATIANWTALYGGLFFGLAAMVNSAVGPRWEMRTWGIILTVSDLTPNVGMWWYFFTEIFDHFRPFFRGVFQLHTLIYVAPLCLRLRDPLQVVLILTGLMATWKSYPTLGDMAVPAGLLVCFPEIASNLRHPLFSLTVNLYTAILLPLLHSLWLLTGTGNANFFYAATMVYGLNATLAIADVLGACIGYDLKQGLRQILVGDKRDTKGSDAVLDEKLNDDVIVVQLGSLD